MRYRELVSRIKHREEERREMEKQGASEAGLGRATAATPVRGPRSSLRSAANAAVSVDIPADGCPWRYAMVPFEYSRGETLSPQKKERYIFVWKGSSYV